MKDFKRLIIFLFLALFGYSRVQAQYFQVKDIDTSIGERADYDFFLLKGHPSAKKINDFLWAYQLNAQPEKSAENPFEWIDVPAEGSNQGTTELSYDLLRNDAKIFSVKLSSEYTSASLNEYHQILNFDAQTGNLISPKMLFTEEGVKDLTQKIRNDRRQRLEAFLSTLDTTSTGNIDPGILKTYKSCLEDMQYEDLSANEMTIQHDTLSLKMPSCGDSHYFKATDTADIYVNKFTFEQLAPYLSEYGKCLLKKENSACTFPKGERSFRAVYYGKLNHRYPITVAIFSYYDDTFNGVYFYDKQGKPIQLTGTFHQNGKITMNEESTPDEKMTGIFRLTPDSQGGFTGTWSNGKKTYPVYLN